MNRKHLPHALLAASSLLLAGAAGADEVATVVVSGSARDKALDLDGSAAAASRLGLSLRETPASVEVIDAGLMQRRGVRTLEDALRGAVGVSAGGSASSPALVSTRGFTAGFVSYLYDGSRIAVPSMSARTQDAWNFERIEVLKGPASVMFGEGAIGGAINYVTKRPDPARAGGEVQVAAGSFGSVRGAFGVNRPLGQASAVRLDYSYQKTDGFIERDGQRYHSLTAGFVTALTRDLTLELSADYLNDDAAATYQGSPLVPRGFAAASGAVSDGAGRVLDRRLVFKNYNVDDAVMRADSVWTRAKLTWQIGPGWTLRSEASHYSADRLWRNAENFTFAAPRRLVRDLAAVSHDHQVRNLRVDLAHQGTLGALPQKLVLGAEYGKTRFATERRFSNGGAAANALLAVDILDPAYGSYDRLGAEPALYAGAGNRTDFGATIPTKSLYAEDALNLSDKLTLVAGLRQDWVTLERTTFDLGTSRAAAFASRYKPRSARLGAVYAPDRDSAWYAQVATAAAPVGSGNLLLLSAANTAFALSKGRQIEVGLKQTLAGGRFDYTVALYRIELDNILSRDLAVPTLTVNNGKQSSRGLEAAAAWRVTRQLDVSANMALLRAQFDRLTEAGGISRAGNTPPNVARKLANVWVDYRLGAGAKLGASVNYTGARFANNANSLTMNGYATADAYVSWNVHPGLLTLRVRNIGDKLYAAWTGTYANQIAIGAPRGVDLTYRAAF